MDLSRTIEVPCTPAVLMPYVADLDRYPSWMPLVHVAQQIGVDVGDGDESGVEPAWRVELRARVGVFARSKQLRMVRTQIEPQRLVVFERSEIDGRSHSMWALRAEISPISERSSVCELTMRLHYSGNLWTGVLLEKVLEEEIRRGTRGIIAQVSTSTTQ